MPIEIRPPREDEQERVNFVVAYSFTGDRTAAGREHMRHVEDMAPALCLYDGGELMAALRVYPLRMSVNGAMIGMGGVSSVSCLPEQRRKGHVGRLLRQALSDMRAAGRPLAALYTPHPSLYRKFGWMTASGNLKYTWKPKSVAPYNSAPAAGRAQRLREEEWPLLAGVYARFAAGRTGYIERPERWWKEAVYRVLYDPERKLNDVAAWMDGDAAGGYMTYSSQRERRGPGGEVHTFFIREFIALTSSAYVGLLRFALSHDLADEIGWHGPLDDPLALAVDDAQQVKREWVDDYMLRVVDVEQAIGARPPALGAPEGAFTIEIADAAAPWNQGAWRIECAGGKLSAQKAAGPGDLATDAATFAAIYGGFLRSTDAARCGLAEAGNHEAALLADRILASDYAPYGSDFF
ncbi:MAG: GNAT family N-acetyltransferase [Dehalococcoidia bacterium]|nr:GNAT family N-acetyltransferase [Dehalococcoidia bacterium]